VEFILEDLKKIIDNSTGNSTGGLDFQKIKDNSSAVPATPPVPAIPKHNYIVKLR
jgi:hypothetical protein